MNKSKELFMLALVCANILLWGQQWGLVPFWIIFGLLLIFSLAKKKVVVNSKWDMVLTWAFLPVALVWVGGAAYAAWIWNPVWAIIYLAILVVAVVTSIREGESSHVEPEV